MSDELPTETTPVALPWWRRLWRRIFTRENVYALALCLLVVALIIMTTDSAPTWIYQDF